MTGDFHNLHQHQPVRNPERGFDGIGQAVAEILAHLDAVDDDADIVLFVFVERRQFAHLVHFTVDFGAGEAALGHHLQLFAVLAFLAAGDRRQQVQLGAKRQQFDAVNHLAHGLRFDRQACRGRVGDADAGIEQPQVIVDFRDGADGRARVARGGFLVDGDGGGEPVDRFHIRLVVDVQKLARIGRERLHIAPLPLRIKRVECQRRLARAREAGDHHQLVLRQIEIDVFQIMLLRAADGDYVLGHAWPAIFVSSFPRRRESFSPPTLASKKIPACAGMTTMGCFPEFGGEGLYGERA